METHGDFAFKVRKSVQGLRFWGSHANSVKGKRPETLNRERLRI